MSVLPPRRLSRLVLVLTLLALTVVGLLAPARTAEAGTETGPTIRLSAGSGSAGSSLLVSVTGFSPGERVTFSVGPRAVASPVAGPDGSLTGYRIAVPAVTPLGPVGVSADGSSSRFTAQATWTSLASPWSQPGGSATQTNVNAGENGLRPATVAGLARTDAGLQRWVRTAPTVVGQTVFVGDLDAGAVLATRADGSTLWSRTLPLDGPLVLAGGGRLHVLAGGRLHVLAGGRLHVLAGGRVQTLDQATGTVRWSSTLSVTAGQAALADGVVYVSGTLGSGAGVAALSAATGQTLWSVPLAGASETAAPAVADGRVYVRLAAGGVVALSASTGAPAWTRTLDAPDGCPAAVSGTTVVASAPGGLTALDAATGAVRWSSDAALDGPVAVFGSRVVGALRGDDGLFRATALALSDGDQLWRGVRVNGGAAAANGVVFFARFLTLQAVDPADGDQLAVVSVNTLPAGDFQAVGGVGTPSVAGGAVWVPVARSDQSGRTDAYGLQRFAVRGLDGVPAVRVLDDTDTGTGDDRIVYTGGWVAGTRDGAYQGTFHYARSTNARATVTFTGVGARVWYSQAPNFGRPRVLIDGVQVDTLDQYISKVRRDGVKSWASPLLTPGRHTLVIEAPSTTIVNVDRIDLGTS
ncbi:outer membrane protein assembly factor BamB [Friedmanniella endophytica]|uniref:Outer membrane protein assembly factor BamB n=1 Tax=Microlunatus kandeliicorticis TaxID=1759536 RepID=A0A7W3P4S1_9ACTN|nr:PQQ-binding-like beta-propeller repeat protein [Microlunatus kandeliicorticis]MBA8793199.1 outer membrane protein assembly factor BamB [Microlunatus kandeliicorticis]